MLAYLVIREGSKWTDVFRLIPGQSVTIGRAPINQIVVKDERCSRSHAEIFLSRDQWTVRDLESRNGTMVNGKLVHDDYPLQEGDVIRIGRSQLAFVHDLSKAFSEGGLKLSDSPPPAESDSSELADADPSDILDGEPTTITHRRGYTHFLRADVDVDQSTPKVGLAAASLCKLAFDIARAPDEVTMAKIALDGVFKGAHVDAGAVLLLPKEPGGEVIGKELSIIASRTDTQSAYHRISPFLASTVLAEGEAILARNVMGDSSLASRDSKGEILATSVLCAPCRHGDVVLGLIHLYSTRPEEIPDPDDLEFTLAVADTLAVAFFNLTDRRKLADNLTLALHENNQLREQLGANSEIVGRSPLMAQVGQAIRRAAPSRATVLIRGESGVGKELVARAVHFASPRKNLPFVCLNCAALSESLLESELFGHERGAFTGATDRKIGKFEAAHKGTLMLDEIGEMSPSIQSKFLRVLEGHPFERVGGTQPIKVDVRVIAATNRDLEKAVGEGEFRRDLYFRLHVLEIVVPALRKRPEDISVLAMHFLGKFNAETGRHIRGFTPRAMEQLISYRWPGNVRELKNVIERAVVLSRSDFIDLEDLSLSTLATAGDTAEGVGGPNAGAYQPVSLQEIERHHISATLRATGWNKSKTAGILGIERSTLDRKIRRYELVP